MDLSQRLDEMELAIHMRKLWYRPEGNCHHAERGGLGFLE